MSKFCVLICLKRNIFQSMQWVMDTFKDTVNLSFNFNFKYKISNIFKAQTRKTKVNFCF